MRRDELVRLIAGERVARRPPHEKLGELPAFWTWDEESEGWHRLPASVRQEMRQRGEDAPPVVWREAYDAFFEFLEEDARRPVRNDYLLAEAAALGIEVERVEGEPESYARCPCCGYRTLERRGEFGICPVCLWDDDSGADAFEDTCPSKLERYSGPNHMTRAEYRHAWEARRDEDLRSGDSARLRRYEQFIRE